MWEKQSLSYLSASHDLSLSTIKQRLDQHQLPTTQPYQTLTPGPIFLVIDAYYRNREDGTIVCRAENLQRNLYWRHVPYETIDDYLEGVVLLLEAGWTILGITVDGRRGVLQTLSAYAPVQHCHFHQLAIVTRYLTKNPKLEAGVILRAIALTLPKTNHRQLACRLELWHAKYQSLLKERTYHPHGKWSYTHKRLRSCYYSLVRNLPYLFTYQEHSGMPNTTNSLDGSISHLRTLHRVHRGLSLRRRCKVTEEVLRGKPTRIKH